LRYGLHQPPVPLTVDPERNRASERRLASLQPDVVCFGHGPVLRDAAPKLQAFVAAL
jgi:glyoxylase-like metal-dependent hydrolase (beta-lactamase superfamily II)